MSLNGFVRVSYGLDRNKKICKIKIKPARPPRFFSENLTINNQFILHGLRISLGIHLSLRGEECYECYCIIMTGIKCYCIIMTGVTYRVCHFISPSHDISACVISLLLFCHFGYL